MTLIQNNSRKVEIALKDWTAEEIESLVTKIQAVLDSKRHALLRTKDKRERIKRLLEENGFSEDDLIEVFFVAKDKEPKFTRPPKYRFLNPDDGSVHTWAGVGRTPLILQALLDNGADLDEFLIDG